MVCLTVFLQKNGYVVYKKLLWMGLCQAEQVRSGKSFLMHPHIILHMQEYNPPPPEEIDKLLQDLIKYVAVDYSVDILVKAALLYYQFETIHPFNIGNGRVGRLLPAALLNKKENFIKRF